jgi:hypothetical protein
MDSISILGSDPAGRAITSGIFHHDDLYLPTDFGLIEFGRGNHGGEVGFQKLFASPGWNDN